MEKIWKTEIGPEDLPCTAGEALRRIAGLTAHQVRSAKFRKEGITVNGAAARVNLPLKAGDVLAVRLEDTSADKPDETAGKVIPVDMPLTVLYEDEDLLAVHKDAGVPVHPSHGHYDDTLANAVAWHLIKMPAAGPAGLIRAVGRLDADTSGIVIFAKNKVACERLSRADAVEKTYFAAAFGEIPERMDLTMPVRKMPGELNKMEVLRDGGTACVSDGSAAGEGTEAAGSRGAVPQGWLSAVTHVRKIAGTAEWSLAEVHIETGRTHQIRVHMAGCGHPLLGDPIYGDSIYGDSTYGGREDEAYVCGGGAFDRAALHCGRVKLRQPFTGEMISIVDPLPADFRQIYGEELT